MSLKTTIIKIMNEIPSNLDMLEMVVMQTEPLIIQDTERPKIRPTTNNIQIPITLTNHDIIMDLPNSPNTVVTIKNGLVLGDRLLVASVDMGQRFYIIERLV